MVYNFVQYLRTKFPTETIYSNIEFKTASQESVPDRMIIVQSTGGTEQPFTRYSEPTVQVRVRDTNDPEAYALVYNIFNEMTSRWGLILPAIVVGVNTHPAIETAQIIGIQKPYCLGADENGRIEYIVNFKITFVED